MTHPFRYLALAGGLLVLGASLAAQGAGPGRGFHGLKALNLTEAQQTQVKAIHDKHQAAAQAKMAAAQAAGKAFHTALANPATDTKTLQALHDKVSAAQFDLLMEHRAIQAEITPLLTAEQKAIFEKQGPGFGPGMGRGHHGGPGGPGMPPPEAPKG